jgi:hypothetical protein
MSSLALLRERLALVANGQRHFYGMGNSMAESNLLNNVHAWGEALSWSTETDKLAQAQTALGTYIVEPRPNNKSYQLRFTSVAGERVCPTRFTASNRIAWEAEDHFRRLQAQQQQPSRLKAPAW